MKRTLIFILTALLLFTMVSCGKSGGDESKARTTVEDNDGQKAEEKKVEPDTVDNLFIALDRTIKKGQIAAAKALFSPASLKKIKDPDSVDFLEETLYGQIQYEMNSRFKFKSRKLKARGKGMTRTVVWPSGKVTEVAVQKIGKSYKMDIMKSTGGDNLE